MSTRKDVTMSKHLLSALLFLTLSVTSKADTLTLEKRIYWTQKLPAASGTIQFSTTLNQNDLIDVIFTPSKKIEDSQQLMRLRISDTDCVGEHETSIQYMARDNLLTMYYFEKRLAWRMMQTISISWTSENDYFISANGESAKIKIYKNSRYVHIISKSGQVQLQNLIIEKQDAP